MSEQVAVSARPSAVPPTGSPEARGHVWETAANGSVAYEEPLDEVEYGSHGGPRCAVCHYWYCQHCHDEPPESCEENAWNRDAAP